MDGGPEARCLYVLCLNSRISKRRKTLKERLQEWLHNTALMTKFGVILLQRGIKLTYNIYLLSPFQSRTINRTKKK